VTAAVERARRIYVALGAAAVAFQVGFLLPAISPTRVLWYYPLERRWALEVAPTALAMDWYGRTLLGIGAALVAGGVAWAAARRFPRLTGRGIGVWAAWIATAALFAAALYAWELVFRQPVPEPIPDWYVPR
jgi:hypothetical protein